MYVGTEVAGGDVNAYTVVLVLQHGFRQQISAYLL